MACQPSSLYNGHDNDNQTSLPGLCAQPANRCENAASVPDPVQIWLILPQALGQLSFLESLFLELWSSVFQVSRQNVLPLPLQGSTEEGRQMKRELKVAKRAPVLAGS